MVIKNVVERLHDEPVKLDDDGITRDGSTGFDDDIVMHDESTGLTR